MLDGLGSEAPHVASNPHVAVDCALDGKVVFPNVTIVPTTGAGLAATRAKQILAEAPSVHDEPLVPAYPSARMLAVVQLIVDVVTVAESTKRTLAAQRVNPTVGDDGASDQPEGTLVNAAVAHV